MGKNMNRILMLALLVSIFVAVVVAPASAGYVYIDSSFAGQDIYCDGSYVGEYGDTFWMSQGYHIITTYFYGWFYNIFWVYMPY